MVLLKYPVRSRNDAICLNEKVVNTNRQYEYVINTKYNIYIYIYINKWTAQ